MKQSETYKLSCTTSKQETGLFDEWIYNVWTDSVDWCNQCNKEKNKLAFDDQTKTTRCIQCDHVEIYEDIDWQVLQAKRYVSNRYMPGKYFFNNLSTDEIFKKYLREINHNDWSSWLIHDYVLAKMKKDKPTQEKLTETAKLIVNKMNYDTKPWKTLFEKMDAPDPEIFYQVPQIICEQAQKKITEAAPKENLQAIMQSYARTLNSIYRYSRWKGDRITCWIAREVIQICDIENYSKEFYTKYFSYDPILENFQTDILAGKTPIFDLKETYIQWELRLADNYLAESRAFIGVWAAYYALTAKLGIHALWPPTKTLDIDIKTVKKVTQIVNDPELFRLYDLATELNAIDAKKACWYAKHFIQKVRDLLPKITSIETELAKTAAYIT
jgi:hypothetical protein